MANAVFSPKDFKVFVSEEATTGTAPDLTSTSNLYQLDVDSVSFPSLNVTQVTNVRNQNGRVAHIDDFFQDNNIRATEISLSGTFHKDGGHVMLMQSVCSNALTPDSVADVTLGTNPTATVGKYGESDANKTFTLVIDSPDNNDAQNIVMKGCLCTNFSLTGDMGTDGGQYKFSATISSGRIPDLTDNTAVSGTPYDANHIDMNGIDVSAVKIASKTAPVLSSFGITIDSPAVYTGVAEGAGYQCFGKGEEIAVTANATVKLDSVTMELPSEFDTQSTHDAADLFTLTQTTAGDASISIPCGIMTNVAFNEGEIMMIDVEMKALNKESGNVLDIDLT
tara:strand:+ start:7482 stop:8492 length:1011 start_codon:yes stop_codon:yes gene_type:complete